mgnify:CR=1 FL=1
MDKNASMKVPKTASKPFFDKQQFKDIYSIIWQFRDTYIPKIPVIFCNSASPSSGHCYTAPMAILQYFSVSLQYTVQNTPQYFYLWLFPTKCYCYWQLSYFPRLKIFHCIVHCSAIYNRVHKI